MKVYVIVRKTRTGSIDSVNRVVASEALAIEMNHELNELEKSAVGTGRYEVLTFHLQGYYPEK